MIILHTSDSPDTLDVGVREVREWHVKGRGWKDVGYHYVIRRNGAIEDGRPVDQRGAHCEGKNAESIGICWIGRDRMTEVQRESMYELVSDLLDEFGLKSKDVYGHREFNAGKTCPNFDPEDFRNDLRKWRADLDV
jgi:N-acetyl-anhydromuramyl-L-alanine amidase AmpD